ncbi:MAG: hypothetical protein JWL65_6153 [Gammaproteobacteria bacterium]|nr:hypothetical protein [Gammaproteobacteria bacterium]
MTAAKALCTLPHTGRAVDLYTDRVVTLWLAHVYFPTDSIVSRSATGIIPWTSNYAAGCCCRLIALSSNQLTMTQELIADMLGVRREGVTDAVITPAGH